MRLPSPLARLGGAGVICIVAPVALVQIAAAWVDEPNSEVCVSFLQDSVHAKRAPQTLKRQMRKPVPKVFLGIKSSPQPEYSARRNAWRESNCSKAYADAGFEFAFFVGVPLDPSHELQGHVQGLLETSIEREIEKAMIDESDEYHDMEFVPFRDVYVDLSFKTLDLIRVGYDRGADYIVAHDDEYCASPKAIMDAIDAHAQESMSQQELWAGSYLWNGTEYPQLMPGANGLTAPYFGGHGYMLSRGLAKLIVQDDFGHNVMFGPYGNGSEDANLGKWVLYAQQRHNISVGMQTIPLISDIQRSTH